MDFIKSWKFAMIVFAVLCVAAIGGVIYGVTTHEEAGLMENVRPVWERRPAPVGVCVLSYGQALATQEDAGHASGVVSEINARLGLDVFEMVDEGTRCVVPVTYGVPVENNAATQIDPGGSATLSDTMCSVELYNVTGELKSLVLMHELGHCLGLAHDTTNAASIMRPVQRETQEGQYPPRISDFDRALLRELIADQE